MTIDTQWKGSILTILPMLPRYYSSRRYYNTHSAASARRPGQQLYFAAARPQQHADAIVRNEDPANPALLLPDAG
ncbi:MAG TPA: hypothetical protein VE258_17145 [Ktedonobacterales bacterium]|nr:hypothetical protein [Ktedonobacterales bacterium]